MASICSGCRTGVAVGSGVGVAVSVGINVGSAVAVAEGTVAVVESKAGLFVPQAFSINKAINMYQ